MLVKLYMMRFLIACFVICVGLLSCKNEPKAPTSSSTSSPAPEPTGPTMTVNDPDIEEKLKNMKPNANNKGITEIKGVNMSHPISSAMVSKGKQVFANKCASCHSIDGSSSSASNLSNSLTKRKPEWIMNMIYNPNVNVAANARESRELAKCYTRQPNQALSIMEARDFLELLRTFQ